MNNNYDKYKDIINLSHPVSKKHSQMSIHDRAAQFAPFAALTGYEEAVKETARLTYEKIEIDEELKQILNDKLNYIKEKTDTKPKVIFTYFIPDPKKTGGNYKEIIGRVKKIDEYKQIIVLEDGKEIPINEIIKIEIL